MLSLAALLLLSSAPASPPSGKAPVCKLTPKQVVTRFMDEFYIKGEVRHAFETWVDPTYIQHNPYAASGRDAAIAFLEPFMKANPGHKAEIKRILADGNLVMVHTHSRMKPEERGSAVVDIFRVKGCKVMEHWDVLQPVPEKSANNNTMF
ncbi:putative SnoaL-like aldol condensation-catalyzing enzyme [Novosphingobium sp. SG751A]|uniref:nuclear transport factor 2 family protein n=1 Tax=Novosphingobium sp. SG751A TaxID=2587000 RepID=UPI001555788A|nr:nuclear transport factor 2 family protein [Novosphingobium sp. SG751A]NOW47183.1 putative SnoaL-like aldol condensation-catalyzing enzyme [Novosphingobium sp. SG751A]